MEVPHEICYFLSSDVDMVYSADSDVKELMQIGTQGNETMDDARKGKFFGYLSTGLEAVIKVSS